MSEFQANFNQNSKGINKKSVALSGHQIINSYAQEEMTIDCLFGVPRRLNLFSSFMIMKPQSRQLLGHLINMVCWFQEEELQIEQFGSEIPLLAKPPKLLRLVHKFAL